MTPEQENAVIASTRKYERMMEKARQTQSDAYVEFRNELHASEFTDDLIDDLFNRVIRYDPNKDTEQLTREWLQSMKAEGNQH